MRVIAVIGTHQVQHSVGVPSELGHLAERRILPHQDLVLGVAVGADLGDTGAAEKGFHTIQSL